MNYDGFEVDMLNVGDGDAIMATKWSNDVATRVLIDGGDVDTVDTVRSFLLGRGINYIDHAVCSHPHDDHAAGLVELVNDRRLNFGRLWMHQPWKHVNTAITTRAWLQGKTQRIAKILIESLETQLNLAKVAAERSIPMDKEPFAGEQIGPLFVCGPTMAFYEVLLLEFSNLDKLAQYESGMEQRERELLLEDMLENAGTVLPESGLIENPETSPENNSSTVLWAKHGAQTFVLTSDAGAQALEKARESYQIGGCYWMQVPHHGSRRNITQSLINYFSPSIAYVSAAGKRYRLPSQDDLRCTDVQIEELEDVFRGVPYGIPDEATPKGGGKRASRAFSVQNYGLMKWRDLFTPRQLMAAGVFVKHTRAAIARLKTIEPENAEAISAYLTVIFGKAIDYMSTECRWRDDHQKVVGTIAGYKLPMVLDFAEANPITGSDRIYTAAIRAVSDAVGSFMRVCSKAPYAPMVRCVSSLATELDRQDLCFTDPPYYDAIPYADLMNFFRIWQKRIIGDFSPEFREVFERPSPTWDASQGDGELIDDDSRHGGDAEASRRTYEDGMTRAFQRSLDALKDDGRMVVVFANKEVDAWQSLIAALIRSGAVVTASWPIQTEMVNKVTQKRANLSTSVWIVCRKRDPNASFGWEDDVLAKMRSFLLDQREELGGKNILRYSFHHHRPLCLLPPVLLTVA